MAPKLTVIGSGFMGEKHAQGVYDHPELDLQSIVDVNEQRARSVAETYDADEYLREYETALDRADAAIIATPESNHFEQATAALDRDVHFILEKPITEDVRRARQLADRASDADIVTATGFLLRYETAYAKAREAVVEGDIGDIVGARVKRTVTDSEVARLGERAHPLFYTSIHDIDFLNYCFGCNVTEISAAERRGSHDVDIPDAVQAVLTFENGAIATVEGYSVLPENTPKTPDASLELTGTDGYVSVNLPSNELTVYSEQYDHPDTRHWPVVDGRIRGAVRNQIDRFADAIDGRGEVSATITDGHRAQVVADAIQQAAVSSDTVEVGWKT